MMPLTQRMMHIEKGLEITVQDQAGGIPPEKIEAMTHTTFEEIIWNERGRGLLLVQALVDEW
ncbi:ATP-binding protein, partial [Cohnella sp. REN36]|uniref:ATP-binding protein n=1 Tax=Cohnella sp. REN36 TaxID=2887347 RepID=UPI00351D9D49|nr:hypothetical protein [Cohnella sp. REN36]